MRSECAGSRSRGFREEGVFASAGAIARASTEMKALAAQLGIREQVWLTR
jgi:hypothetical protein